MAEVIEETLDAEGEYKHYFRLSPAIDVARRIWVGKTFKYLHPNTIYGTDSDSVIEALKELKIKLRPTPKLEAILEENNIEYQKVPCKSCGGRIIKLEFAEVQILR